MALAFDITIPAYNGTSPQTSGLFSPTAGDLICSIGVTGTTGTATITQAASSGPAMSGSSIGNFNDGEGDTFGLWTQLGAAGGAETITLTSSGNGMRGLGICYSGAGAITNAAINGGTVAEGSALNGTTVTVATGSLLLVAVFCTSDVSAAWVVGTGSPQIRIAQTNGAGPFSTYALYEYAGSGSAFTPNFTTGAAVSTETYVIMQWVIPPASAGKLLLLTGAG